MKLHTSAQLTQAALMLCAVLALPYAQAASMSKADYKDSRDRIEADYKAERTACASFAGNARDVCVEEGRAKKAVALAELEFNYSAKPQDQRKVLVAKADSAYAVAKEKCDDKAGNEKSVCVKEAKAVKVKALADVKMGGQISDARTDAAADKRGAEYQVAVQKCDAMSGDAKSNCMSAAKSRFGKV